jgi:hypothetical protein
MTGYRLDDWGLIPGGGRDFLYHHIQTSNWAHPAFYPVVFWAFSLGVKQAVLTTHLYLVPRLRMYGSPYASMVRHRNVLSFYLW